MITNVIEEAIEVLLTRPSALISDMDGTLSPIVAEPSEAIVLPECLEALATLKERVDLVAVVSGRTVNETRRMVGLDGLVYFGNHGLERWDASSGYRNEAEGFESEIRSLRERLDAALRTEPEVRVEDKGVVLSLHYRGAARPEEVRQRLLRILDDVLSTDGLTLAEGKMVIEVRPPLGVDKGTVVEDLASEHRLKGVIYLGDDATDVDAMRALRRLRDRGLQTLAIAAGSDEMPALLAEAADVVLPDPQTISLLLGNVAAKLS